MHPVDLPPRRGVSRHHPPLHHAPRSSRCPRSPSRALPRLPRRPDTPAPRPGGGPLPGPPPRTCCAHHMHPADLPPRRGVSQDHPPLHHAPRSSRCPRIQNMRRDARCSDPGSRVPCRGTVPTSRRRGVGRGVGLTTRRVMLGRRFLRARTHPAISFTRPRRSCAPPVASARDGRSVTGPGVPAS